MPKGFSEKEEHLIGTAVNFVSKAEIKEKPVNMVRAFLKGKGFTDAMLDEVYKRIDNKNKKMSYAEERLSAKLELSKKTKTLVLDDKSQLLDSIIDKIDHLETLILINHEITGIPSQINKLDNLETFIAIGCKLTNESFPADFNKLKSLENLILKANSISSIDPFLSIKNLVYLNLKNNAVEKIDNNLIKQCQSLRVLNLEGNRLKEYPPDMPKETKIKG